jgi:hypothetical protein
MRSKPERNQIITKEEKVGCGTTVLPRRRSISRNLNSCLAVARNHVFLPPPLDQRIHLGRLFSDRIRQLLGPPHQLLLSCSLMAAPTSPLLRHRQNRSHTLCSSSVRPRRLAQPNNKSGWNH